MRVLLLLLRAAEFFKQVELVLHLVYEFACGGAVVFVWVLGGTHPALLCLGAVMRVIGL